MKKAIFLLTLIAVVFSAFCVFANEKVDVAENGGIYFSFDGNETICFDEVTNKYLYPLSYNDRTYVPLRFLCNYMGLGVEWIEETKTIALSSEGEKTTNFIAPVENSEINKITAEIDTEINFTWNGEEFSIIDPATSKPVYALMYNDRTFIPARFIAEKAGFNVGWEEETQKITITSPKPEKEEELLPKITEPSDTTPYSVMVAFSEETLDWLENSLLIDKEELFNDNFFTYYEKMQAGEKIPESFYKLIIALNVAYDYSEHFLPAALENSNGYANAFGKIIVIHSNPGDEKSDASSKIYDHYCEIKEMAGYEDVFSTNALVESSFAEPYLVNGRATIMNFANVLVNYINQK